MQQKYTVLVIDDDRTELNIMITVLSSAGLRVLVAEDGETGFHRAIFARPDLILLDVVMPGIDGYETCQKLHKHPRTQHIPIFFKTCKYDESSMVDGFEVGGERFITKPSDHDELLSLIKSRLASVRLDHLQSRLQSL